VITTDASLLVRIGQALNFGFLGTRECQSASTNGKMSEYHAALGLAELDGWAERRRKLQILADQYRLQFDTPGVRERLIVAPEVASCYALFRCNDGAEATSILQRLEAANVESRYWYGYGLHGQPYYANASRDPLPVTERIAPLLIGLPVAPDLSSADVHRVVAAIVERMTSGTG
jgi:dTDP-4-amino-4,6-dideoxygalactose transaminase